VDAAGQYALMLLCTEWMQESKTKTAAQVAEWDHRRDQDRLHAFLFCDPCCLFARSFGIIKSWLYFRSSHHILVFVNLLCFTYCDYYYIFVFVNLLHHLSEGSDW